MKKLATMLKIAAVMALALLLGGGCDDGIDWLSNESTGSKNKVNFDIDDEVLVCYNLTNKFRTGNEAFYLNSDNKTNTNLVGKLGELTLDEELCKAAAIRAEEIVKSFSHTRPNGKSCFTVFDDLGIKTGYKAENIAMGNTSGEKTFLQWKEDGKPYSEQGHRRNMLSSSATKIGIAHDSSGRYWVMILSN
ncbi:MAG: CAP domain-containing protein [Treponema sp.]|nr:CAP domain-containing protein [Treponema sp.]